MVGSTSDGQRVVRLHSILVAIYSDIMTFSHADLDHIIHLAHLEVSPELRETYLPQIQSILAHMESINQFDLSDVQPLATAFNTGMPLREDTVVPQQSLRLSDNAPAWTDGGFLVPRINS